MTASKFSRRNVILGAASAALLPWDVAGQEREIEGGIGGTGIVGLLTGFGSLIVAGRLVHTNARTAFTDAFGRIAESGLALGDSLTVEAAGPSDALVARRVHVTHPLVGPVSAVSGRTATINNVSVTLPSSGPRPAVGTRVAVSGLWRGNRVVASRITPARTGNDLVAGDITRDFGGTRVGGVRANAAALSRQPVGSFATAIGRYDAAAGRLVVGRVDTQRFTQSAGALRALVVEGFLEPARGAPGFRISGLGHSFARNLDLAPFAGSRTLFAGPYTGLFAANSALVLPENTRQRRAILRSLSR